MTRRGPHRTEPYDLATMTPANQLKPGDVGWTVNRVGDLPALVPVRVLRIVAEVEFGDETRMVETLGMVGVPFAKAYDAANKVNDLAWEEWKQRRRWHELAAGLHGHHGPQPHHRPRGPALGQTPIPGEPHTVPLRVHLSGPGVHHGPKDHAGDS